MPIARSTNELAKAGALVVQSGSSYQHVAILLEAKSAVSSPDALPRLFAWDNVVSIQRDSTPLRTSSGRQARPPGPRSSSTAVGRRRATLGNRLSQPEIWMALGPGSSFPAASRRQAAFQASAKLPNPSASFKYDRSSPRWAPSPAVNELRRSCRPFSIDSDGDSGPRREALSRTSASVMPTCLDGGRPSLCQWGTPVQRSAPLPDQDDLEHPSHPGRCHIEVGGRVFLKAFQLLRNRDHASESRPQSASKA